MKREKSESEIVRDICEYLKELKIPHSVTNASANMGGWKRQRGFKTTKGWPDIVGVIPIDGKFLAIEVKTKDGKVSLEQAGFLQVLKESKACVIVARSVRDVSEAIRGV